MLQTSTASGLFRSFDQTRNVLDPHLQCTERGSVMAEYTIRFLLPLSADVAGLSLQAQRCEQRRDRPRAAA